MRHASRLRPPAPRHHGRRRPAGKRRQVDGAHDHSADWVAEFRGVRRTTKLADAKGAVQTEIVTTSFTLKGGDARRAVTFAINGGPGASSAWLNLGAIGPWRVPFSNPIIPSATPTPVDNAETWLDQTDLVFIDPPGTGFSRVTASDDARRHFYSVEGDIDTLAAVIRRWLEAHGRLLSPKYIVGESYGGFRGPK
ncbi:MAG: hypothetical protein RQ966_14530, partial [Acetobacteraceae bacterium]|nr:hypothetical protein [Acetobacteraceae bacterium]